MVFPGFIPPQIPPTYDARIAACIGHLPPLSEVVEHGRHYGVRRLSWSDTQRHDEYQRLRASIFVHQLGWSIPVDERGRERDCYDWQADVPVSMHCVYGVGHDGGEHLLAGVRVFDLETWGDSMMMHEFREAGMLPGGVLQLLERCYDCRALLELTRLCVRRGRWYIPPGCAENTPGFSCPIARDLIYAAVYAQAEQTERWSAIGLAASRYLQVMRRSHFVFQEIYARCTDEKSGYALVHIDLLATLQAIRTAGDHDRANRMLALCTARH